MNDDPLRAIAHHDGVFLYREALDAGYTKAAIAAMRRQGIWHRVRHGAYCFGDVWATLSAEERHVVLARAVARTTPGPIAFSHTTALVLHGIAVWGADLSRVHATRLDEGAYRREVDVVHHVGLCNDNDLSTAQGLPVVRPGRAVIEHASITSTESGLVSADNALFTQMTTPAELRDFNERFTNWPGSQPFHVVLHHMDGRAESVGETRARHLFWRQGLPTPELQWEVHDAGRLIASTDFAWQQHRLFGEFDGRAKYLRPYHDGDDPGDVVFREKQREDLIRRLTGWRFVRFVWADLARPQWVAAQIRQAMRDAAA
ncbi:type IV toxin-antitoxin system AbiEi family antitoxin domain-containing protein [Nocardioides terrisoli]|uniref:type IV toxin-antitoxin system AbiEi family antitoxin domain-containing protein n=1 Tax=Nocardioides terrisoli TaxID=3388267 RepID=UPI00287B8BCF|nr:type IV toxin-antitoxin system AbiEi family antitoxin domain-containing protein [Nocardioides marmorisolisilvae]